MNPTGRYLAIASEIDSKKKFYICSTELDANPKYSLNSDELLSPLIWVPGSDCLSDDEIGFTTL